MKFRKKEHFARQIRIDIVKKSDIMELVMNMKGIDLNKPIEYKFSSFRFFEEKEKRYTQKGTAAETDELSFGQVEKDLGFHVVQVFRYGYISHILTSV